MGQRKYLDILQVYRGIAALVVVIHHTIPSILFFNGLDNDILLQVSSYGKLGVDFFFVLSGFIIAYTNLGRGGGVKDYFLRRTTRIYIPYLPIGIAMMILYWIMPNMSASDRDFSLINSLTLFPIGNPALSVAWSLSYEMFFYLLFLICIWNRRYFHVLVFFWSLLIFISLAGDIKFNSFLFNFYILEFFIGYILAYGMVRNKWKLYAGIMVLILGINYLVLPDPLSNLTIAVGFSALIFVSIAFYDFRLSSNHLLMLIGTSSYSIYLIHNPLQSLLVRRLTFIPDEHVIWIVLFIVLIASVIIGYIYYFVFEKKLTKLIYNKLR